MQISNVRIKNFRAFSEIEANFEELTIFLGENNAGKSTILKALELFFDNRPTIGKQEHYFQDETKDIEITVSFISLVPAEIEEFGSAVSKGVLTVKRVFSKNSDVDGLFQVNKRVNKAFEEIRNETNGTTRRSLYNKIAEQYELPKIVKSHEEIKGYLEEWEANNPEGLEFEYVRGFFGVPNVAGGKLKKKTELVFVPAVLSSNETFEDERKSPIKKLLNDLTKQAFENKKEISEFLENAREEYQALADPNKIPGFSSISEMLTENLQEFYQDSSMQAAWHNNADVTISYPTARISIEDGGFATEIDKVGHGLQRAALLAILRYLAESKSTIVGEGFTEAQSDIILLIEEPEIYQHPQKQMVMRNALSELSGFLNTSNGIRIQIAYTTHSEKMLSIDNFDSVQVIRKNILNDGCEHQVSRAKLDQCIKFFADYKNVEPMSRDAFIAKMHIFSREVCEGFFARKVILVEGETDKRILEGFYQSLNRSPYMDGYSIIQMNGKTCMDKPMYIFSELGIPVFAIFDSDVTEAKPKNQKPETNRLLQFISGVELENLEDYPDGVFDKFAAFETRLEGYLIDVAGSDLYDVAFGDIAEEYGLSLKEISKTPDALSACLVKFQEAGKDFERLNAIIEKIDAL